MPSLKIKACTFCTRPWNMYTVIGLQDVVMWSGLNLKQPPLMLREVLRSAKYTLSHPPTHHKDQKVSRNSTPVPCQNISVTPMWNKTIQKQ